MTNLKRTLAAIGIAMLPFSGASAAVIYSFQGSYTPIGETTSYSATFTVETALPITALGLHLPTSCTTTQPDWICGIVGQEFNPVTFAGTADWVALLLGKNDFSQAASYYYFFAPGAFLANGTYLTADTTPPQNYGNAGPGTLTVRGITGTPVPAPATLALVGLGVIAFAARRRR